MKKKYELMKQTVFNKKIYKKYKKIKHKFIRTNEFLTQLKNLSILEENNNLL